MRTNWIAVLLSVFAISLHAQQGEPVPTIDGYVTRVGSPTDFDANGFRVVTTARTQFLRGNLFGRISTLVAAEPRFAGHVLIFGKLDTRGRTVKAGKIYFVPPGGGEAEGSGLIDSLPAPRAGDSSLKLVRADGYLIMLTSKTGVTLTPPLGSLSDVGANVWISYRGERRPDGVVVASSAVFRRNEFTSGQEKTREKSEYDPASVAPDARQRAASRAFLGVDPKKIPPYVDDAMQTRIRRIGDSLVPQYQKDLPDGDPTKFQVRFQLVDEPKWRDTLIFPSGVVLVSKQVVERMENDAQLAAVLADAIAGLLNNGCYSLQSLRHKTEAVEIASVAVPFGIVPDVAASKVYADAERRVQDQAARVSLDLMSDAGYELAEAPKAWWILSSKKPKPLVDVQLPERVRYLYEALDSTWRER